MVSVYKVCWLPPLEVASILVKILYFLLVSEKGSQTSGRDTGVWKPLHVYLY